MTPMPLSGVSTDSAVPGSLGQPTLALFAIDSTTLIGLLVVAGLSLFALRRVIVAAWLSRYFPEVWRCGDDERLLETLGKVSREVITGAAIMGANRWLLDQLGVEPGGSSWDNVFYWRWETIGGIILATVVAGLAVLVLYYAWGRRDPVKRQRREFQQAVLGGDLAEVRSRIEAGANINAAGFGGSTPLMHAVRKGSVDVVKLLLGHGADLTARSKEGATALTVAVYEDQAAVAELLLAGGADPNTHTKEGVTPLIVAAARGWVNIVGCMLAAGADPNVQSGKSSESDVSHVTALIAAVKGNRTGVVEVLLRAGARTDSTDEQGKTAFDLATENERHEIVRLIRQDRASESALFA